MEVRGRVDSAPASARRGSGWAAFWHERRTPLPLLVLGGLTLLYLIGPLLLSFTTLTGDGIRSFALDPQAGQAIVTSFVTASVATAVVAAGAVPLGYALAQGRGGAVRLVGLLASLPLALPPLMSGIVLLSVVGPYSPLGSLLSGVPLTDSPIGIVIAQVFVAAPFTVIGAREAFAALDPALADAAAVDGGGAWPIFWFIALPLAWPMVSAALALTWLRALGEFGATVVLAYHPYTLPVYVWVQLSSGGLAPAMPAVALLVLLIVGVLGTLALAGRVVRG